MQARKGTDSPATALRPRAAAAVGLLAAAWLNVGAAELPRLARARLALHELAHLYAEAEPHGEANLYDRVAIAVGEAALAQLEAAAADERARILDHVHNRCSRAREAILQTIAGRRPKLAVPAAPALAALRLAAGGCRRGESLVLPVAVGAMASGAAEPCFSPGELVRLTPALAGATGESLERTEVFRIYQGDEGSRRIGWERPAGGLVRDAAPGRPAVLISIEHAAMREAIARETARAIAAWPAGPGPLYHSLGRACFYVDYSPLSAARFAAWLKKRRGSVRVVNALWGTRYRAFGPEMMPRPERPADNPARWHDWALFNQQRLTRHVRWAMANVRRGSPDVPIGLPVARYMLAGSHGLSGVDPAALAEVLDVLDADGADALRFDLCVSLAAGRPVVDAAVGPGPFGVLPHFLHGSAAVRLRQWPQEPLTSLEAVLHAERALEEALEARRLARAIGAFRELAKPVALLYSETSLRQAPAWAMRAEATPYTRQLGVAYEAARFLDAGCGFVTGADLVRARLRGARLVVVASSACEEERVARALVRYVERGGHVLMLPGSLTHDELGHEADYLLRLGVEVLETAAPSYSTKPRPDRGGALDAILAANVPTAAVTPASDGPLGRVRRPFQGAGLKQSIQVNVVHKVIAAYASGGPAIVSFGRGKGRVTYVAMSLAPRDLAPVVEMALREAGAPGPLVRLARGDGAAPWGIECRSVRSDGRVLAYVWNTTSEEKRVVFETGGPVAALNLSTRRPIRVRRAAGKPHVLAGPVRLAPFTTTLIEFAAPTARP